MIAKKGSTKIQAANISKILPTFLLTIALSVSCSVSTITIYSSEFSLI